MTDTIDFTKEHMEINIEFRNPRTDRDDDIKYSRWSIDSEDNKNVKLQFVTDFVLVEWEEHHPDGDIDARMVMFPTNEINRITGSGWR